MKDFATFSVIIPSYNQGVYLRELLESIIRQDYPYIQIIIIDGGSTDSTLQVIREYDDYIYFWESCADKGQTSAINRGLSLATSEWVCWQNSDDLFSHECSFSIYNSYIKAFPSSSLFFSDIYIINYFSRILRPIKYSPLSYRRLYVEGMQISNQSAFWKKSLHYEFGFLNESYDYCFDYAWFLLLAQENIKSIHIPQILGSFRIHNNSKTSADSTPFALEMKDIRSKSKICFSWFTQRCLRVYLLFSRCFYYISSGSPTYLLIALSRVYRISH